MGPLNVIPCYPKTAKRRNVNNEKYFKANISHDIRVVGGSYKDVKVPDTVHVVLKVRPAIRVGNVSPGE